MGSNDKSINSEERKGEASLAPLSSFSPGESVNTKDLSVTGNCTSALSPDDRKEKENNETKDDTSETSSKSNQADDSAGIRSCSDDGDLSMISDDNSFVLVVEKKRKSTATKIANDIDTYCRVLSDLGIESEQSGNVGNAEDELEQYFQLRVQGALEHKNKNRMNVAVGNNLFEILKVDPGDVSELQRFEESEGAEVEVEDGSLEAESSSADQVNEETPHDKSKVPEKDIQESFESVVSEGDRKSLCQDQKMAECQMGACNSKAQNEQTDQCQSTNMVAESSCAFSHSLAQGGAGELQPNAAKQSEIDGSNLSGNNYKQQLNVGERAPFKNYRAWRIHPKACDAKKYIQEMFETTFNAAFSEDDYAVSTTLTATTSETAVNWLLRNIDYFSPYISQSSVSTKPEDIQQSSSLTKRQTILGADSNALITDNIWDRSIVYPESSDRVLNEKVPVVNGGLFTRGKLVTESFVQCLSEGKCHEKVNVVIKEKLRSSRTLCRDDYYSNDSIFPDWLDEQSVDLLPMFSPLIEDDQRKEMEKFLRNLEKVDPVPEKVQDTSIRRRRVLNCVLKKLSEFSSKLAREFDVYVCWMEICLKEEGGFCDEDIECILERAFSTICPEHLLRLTNRKQRLLNKEMLKTDSATASISEGSKYGDAKNLQDCFVCHHWMKRNYFIERSPYCPEFCSVCRTCLLQSVRVNVQKHQDYGGIFSIKCLSCYQPDEGILNEATDESLESKEQFKKWLLQEVLSQLSYNEVDTRRAVSDYVAAL